MIDNLALSIEKIVLISSAVGGLIIMAVIFWLVKRRLPRRPKAKHFKPRWLELQKLLAHKETWADAIIEADDLLAAALKKRLPKGKNLGERLVRAQHLLSDNDAVWFAHKLRNKLDQKPGTSLSQQDVKDALLGVGQALKDLGAL